MNPWIYTIVYTSAAIVLLLRAWEGFATLPDLARGGAAPRAVLALGLLVGLDANVWLEVATSRTPLDLPWYFALLDLSGVHIQLFAAAAIAIAAVGHPGPALNRGIRAFEISFGVTVCYWVLMLATQRVQTTQTLFRQFGIAGSSDSSPIGMMINWVLAAVPVPPGSSAPVWIWSFLAILLYGGAVFGARRAAAAAGNVELQWRRIETWASIGMMLYGLLGPIGTLPPAVRVVFLWPLVAKAVVWARRRGKGSTLPTSKQPTSPGSPSGAGVGAATTTR